MAVPSGRLFLAVMKDTLRERPVVLLVETPDTDRPSLADRLDFAGYTVWRAESGADARQMLAEARRSHAEPDMIVLERFFPAVDGLGFAAFLLAHIPKASGVCTESG